MKRTKKLFVTVNNQDHPFDKRPSVDEVFEGTTKTEKANLLCLGTDIQNRIINIKKDSFNIGEMLTKAKKILQHGQFGKWIEYTFDTDLAYSTAYFYMKIYELFKDKPSAVKNFPVTYLLQMIQNEFPKEILDAMKKHPEKLSNGKLKIINEVYSLYKKGTIGSNQMIKLALDQIKIGKDGALKSTEYRINKLTRHSFEFGASDILKRIRQLREIARSMAGLCPLDPTSREHKNLMNDIERTIDELKGLKNDLTGKGKFFHPISTRKGIKHISNF